MLTAKGTSVHAWAVTLSWLENALSTPTFGRAILTRKVGQTDLVCGVRSRFISRSVHARLKVFVCSGYVTSRQTDTHKTHTQTDSI